MEHLEAIVEVLPEPPGLHLRLPPLRERPGDIPLLIESALERVQGRLAEGTRPTCSPFAVRLLRSYDWPGNVRELMGVIESAVIRAGGGRVEAQHLPPETREGSAGAGVGTGPGDGNGEPSRYSADLDPAEEEASIRAALERTDGARAQAAEMLGMSRTTLWRKMKEYGL
ncbi:MAG: helix-turn-helix domain-containing protein [Gemmatimonadota bacterium]